MERTVAVALVMLLTIVVCGCSGHSSEEPKTAATTAQSDVASMLPPDGAVAGWTRKAAKLYGANDLWEYIDGGAESYIACGYREVMSAEYVIRSAQDSVLVDIYRMADARGAFGIYSQEMDPAADFRPLGTEGYVHGTVVNFWGGPFYVKLTTFRDGDELRQAMVSLATAIAARIHTPAKAPSETSWFPAEGLVPHTVRYLPVRVLGQPFLSNGFEARYRQGGNEYGLVLVAIGEKEKPEDIFAKLRAHVAETHEVSSTANTGDEAFTAQGKDGRVVAVRAGNRIVVALGAAPIDTMAGQTKMLLERATASRRP